MHQIRNKIYRLLSFVTKRGRFDDRLYETVTFNYVFISFTFFLIVGCEIPDKFDSRKQQSIRYGEQIRTT